MAKQDSLKHDQMIRAIIEEFGPRFLPGAQLIHASDTSNKSEARFDQATLAKLGVEVAVHAKMPDVVFYYPEKHWLVLMESVTSNGPIDGLRREELTGLFAGATAGLVFVTAVPTREVMSGFLENIAWETEVWIADHPSHMIHFNGERFLGPY